MSRKKTIRNVYDKRTKNEQKPIPWKYCLLTLVCGLFLIVGFFFAARQHFSSIDYSIKNSRLKKQIEELEADKRRMILAKEIALSPGEIKRAAKKIGLQEMTAGNIAVYSPSSEPQEKLKTEKPEDAKLKSLPEAKTEELKRIDKKEDKKPINEVKETKKAPEKKDKQEKTVTQIARK